MIRHEQHRVMRQMQRTMAERLREVAQISQNEANGRIWNAWGEMEAIGFDPVLHWNRMAHGLWTRGIGVESYALALFKFLFMDQPTVVYAVRFLLPDRSRPARNPDDYLDEWIGRLASSPYEVAFFYEDLRQIPQVVAHIEDFDFAAIDVGTYLEDVEPYGHSIVDIMEQVGPTAGIAVPEKSSDKRLRWLGLPRRNVVLLPARVIGWLFPMAKSDDAPSHTRPRGT